MDEKLYKLIEIVKGESYNFKFVKKIIFEYDERTYSLTKVGD